MIFAVFEMGDFYGNFASGVFGFFFNSVEFFAQALVLVDFFLEFFGCVGVFVKKVDDGTAGV